MERLLASSIACIPSSSGSNTRGFSMRGLAMGRLFIWRLQPPPLLRRTRSPNILCMAEPYLITKLDSAERTWKELSVTALIIGLHHKFKVKLADPDVVSNPSEYQKIAQSMAELDEVVSSYHKFKECERQIEETKALAKEDEGDPDMAEMIAYEVETLTNQLKELEEKLKVEAMMYRELRTSGKREFSGVTVSKMASAKSTSFHHIFF